ncbi:hypothetical protein LPN01_11620 [Sphingomonas sp. A2-49]|uniref:hypothetical protein n=1 Tax=Sphingomonas sp. A2-49 TaxID=1391375 RepID=UPI0021D3798B|nr:hypothetical protein [Sphingomonas sp. A2-49]MCU6454725.1 hypothetical protein [Sphingomonas sp. A2-49]
MTDLRQPVPTWFRIVAVVLLIWGAVGVFACVQQLRLGAEAMGPADAYYRRLYASFPGWYNPVYAVATGAGLFAALALLARSALAGPLYVLSLIAVIVQFGWLFAATDLIAVRGAAQVVPFPVFIAAVAAFGVWLAQRARRRGWIA